MLHVNEMREVLTRVRYLDWAFVVKLDGDRPYLQVQFMASDTRYGGGPTHQTGRKWFLSPHMTESELVGTAFKAVITAVEHEARENFKYKGRPIYGPHIPIEKLWIAAEYVDAREEQA